jgi:hypothetical protein
MRDRTMRTRIAAGIGLLPTLLGRAEALVRWGWRWDWGSGWRPGWKLTGAPYRPEKHYMRGPGPKWREKHASAGGPGAEPRAGRRQDGSGRLALRALTR